MHNSLSLIKSKLCIAFITLCMSLCGCNTIAPVTAQATPASIDIAPQSVDNDLGTIKPSEPSVSNQSSSQVIKKQIVIDRNKNIFFPPRLAAIDEESKSKLKICAERLKQNSTLKVVLISYSDDLGSKSYELAIADQRIVAVSSMLKSLGVESRQIHRNRSNSVKNPTPTCRSEACHKQLRRIEFICGI